MAISPVTVTLTLSDFLGFVPRVQTTRVILTTNVASGWIADTTTGGGFRVSGKDVTISTAGVASFSVLPSGATGLNPAAYQIRVQIDAVDTATRQHRLVDLGYYTITAACDLKDLVAAQYVPPTSLSSVPTALDAKVTAAAGSATSAGTSATSAAASAAAASSIAGISTTDSAVAALATPGVGPLSAAVWVGRSMTKAASTGRTVLREIADPNRTGSKWREVYGTADFSGQKDPVRFFGWNAEKGLGAGDAAEPALYMGMEADYYVASWNGDGIPHHTMEWYVNYNSPDNATVVNFRPLAFTLGRDNNASHWATISIDIGDDTGARSQLQVIPGQGNSALLSLTSLQAVWTVPLVITPGQIKMGATGDELRLLSDSATQASIDVGQIGTQKMYIFKAFSLGTALSLNVADNLAALTAKAYANTQPALVARGAASQSASLFEAQQNTSSTPLWSITAAGLPKWNAAGNAQTTVGAAGGASALPATPTKYLKIVDSTGTTLVIPAYAP